MEWQPTPIFLPGKSHGQRSLMGYSLWGRRVGDDWSDLAHMCTLIKRLNRGIMKSGMRRKKTEEDVQRAPPREMGRCLWKEKEQGSWSMSVYASVTPGCTPVLGTCRKLIVLRMYTWWWSKKPTKVKMTSHKQVDITVWQVEETEVKGESWSI